MDTETTYRFGDYTIYIAHDFFMDLEIGEDKSQQDMNLQKLLHEQKKEDESRPFILNDY